MDIQFTNCENLFKEPKFVTPWRSWMWDLGLSLEVIAGLPAWFRCLVNRSMPQWSLRTPAALARFDCLLNTQCVFELNTIICCCRADMPFNSPSSVLYSLGKNVWCHECWKDCEYYFFSWFERCEKKTRVTSWLNVIPLKTICVEMLWNQAQKIPNLIDFTFDEAAVASELLSSRFDSWMQVFCTSC